MCPAHLVLVYTPYDYYYYVSLFLLGLQGTVYQLVASDLQVNPDKVDRRLQAVQRTKMSHCHAQSW